VPALSTKWRRPIASDDASPIAGQLVHSLRVYPAFRLLLLGTLATNSAFWMYQVAVGWLALQLLDSPLFVGLTGFAGGIPILICSLPAGVIIDRFDRRTVLLLAQIGVMVIAAAFAILVSLQRITPLSTVILVAAYGAVMAFIFPTRTTIVSTLVAREDLANAVALNAAGQNSTRVIGPALAGVLIALIGIAGTFAVAALLQILALAATIRLPRRASAGPLPGGMGRRGLTLGARIVARDGVMARIILLAAATNILVMPYLNMMPVFARDTFAVDSFGLGLLLASTGFGTVVGALWVAQSSRLGAWDKAPVVTASGFTVLVLIFALTPNLPLALAVLFVAGIVSAAFLALAQTVIQLRADDAVRGRVLAIWLLTWGLLPLGQLAVGAAAERIGPSLAMVGACGLALLSIAVVARRFPA
jgi:MFS family permease